MPVVVGIEIGGCVFDVEVEEGVAIEEVRKRVEELMVGVVEVGGSMGESLGESLGGKEEIVEMEERNNDDHDDRVAAEDDDDGGGVVEEVEEWETEEEEERRAEEMVVDVRRVVDAMLEAEAENGGGDDDELPHFELEDKFGRAVELRAEDRKAIVLGMIFHAKGRGEMRKMPHPALYAALVLFEEADASFRAVRTPGLTVSNHDALVSDLVWAYFLAGDMATLANSVARFGLDSRSALEEMMTAARQIPQAPEAVFDRLIKYARLALVLAMLQLSEKNDPVMAREYVEKAGLVLDRVGVREDEVASVVGLGYAAGDVVRAFRCVAARGLAAAGAGAFSERVDLNEVVASIVVTGAESVNQACVNTGADAGADVVNTGASADASAEFVAEAANTGTDASVEASAEPVENPSAESGAGRYEALEQEVYSILATDIELANAESIDAPISTETALLTYLRSQLYDRETR